MTPARTAAATAAVLSALVLASCAGAAPAHHEKPADPASTPAQTPTAEAVEASASCLQIDTTEPTVDGGRLGTCFADALLAHGSARARSDLGGEILQAEFRLRPDQAIHGAGPDGEVILVDEVAYRDDGTGWVKGDIDSDDPEEYITGAAALAMLAGLSGDMVKQSLAACAVWNIEVGEKRLALPDDRVVEARVFSCAAPFESYGTTIAPMSVWFGADWTPYGHESTATGYGQVVHGVTLYYDHGAQLQITAPM